jgi:hypothetical protein
MKTQDKYGPTGVLPTPVYFYGLEQGEEILIDIERGNAGYATSITTSSSTYLGSGDFGKFAQAFGAAQGYISLTNRVIASAANANGTDYLGPTFNNMNDLISADIWKINLAGPAFGADLALCGDIFALDNIEYLGTPAGLLNQIAKKGNMINGSTPCVTAALQAQGLTEQDIANLVNINVESLFNPTGLNQNAFDTLQKNAYPAFLNVSGSCLQDVLDILNSTLPNIANMADLLNPVKLFPTSYVSMTLPTPNGPILIFDLDGSTNSQIEPVINSGSVSVTGCEDLAKIIPPGWAAAARAIQIAFQQIKGISVISVPQLASILQ